ncbi:MAG: SPOR domain-containing protein [Pseudomonadota bacterium]
MAFFKFRKGGDDATIAKPSQSESVDAMRRRARQRLIGAAVLVLAGIVGFPLLFDTQPRPIAVDIPIDIPDRNKAKPLSQPGAPTAPVTMAAPPIASPPAVTPAPAVVAKVEPAAPTPAPAKPEAPKPELAKAATPKPEAAKPAAPDDGARAKALLDGKLAAAAATTAANATNATNASSASSAASADDRFVVQVGAFADAAKAREARLKLERAGLKTYTHVAETKDGKRIRVRVGPFPTRAEADKAAQKVKGLDLPAAILTL